MKLNVTKLILPFYTNVILEGDFVWKTRVGNTYTTFPDFYFQGYSPLESRIRILKVRGWGRSNTRHLTGVVPETIGRTTETRLIFYRGRDPSTSTGGVVGGWWTGHLKDRNYTTSHRLTPVTVTKRKKVSRERRSTGRSEWKRHKRQGTHRSERLREHTGAPQDRLS